MLVGVLVIYSSFFEIAHWIFHLIKKRYLGDFSVERKLKLKFWLSVFAIIIILIIGIIWLIFVEEESFVEALYFAMQTSTTVGYGDIPIRYYFSFFIALQSSSF